MAPAMSYTERCPVCFELVTGGVMEHAGHLLSPRHRRAYDMVGKFNSGVEKLRAEDRCTREAVDALIEDLRNT